MFQWEEASELSVLENNNDLSAKEDLFACPVCQKQFDRKFNLKVHFRTHTGERPFKCDLCPMYFTTRSNFKVHYRRWHVKDSN